MTGRTIAHYEVLEKLGEGGMGVVYKARDTRLGRFVALKLLPADKIADEERLRRFTQEARTASGLNHPNIVTIHDIASEAGVQYMAMEFIAGKTLDQIIPRKGMRLAEVLKIGAQIAEALAAAAAAGVIHRDIKPGNVMVTDHGHVKVLDFGLAKLAERAISSEEATATYVGDVEEPRTREGTVIGTVCYMSPEQAEGKPLDPRSDIFSFGALLYEMTTGQRAFRGDTSMSTISAILRDDPVPAGQLSPDVPRDLEKIIARCLRKDPERRFQTMADVRVALLELKEESESGRLPGPAVTPARRANRGWVFASGAAILLAAAVFFGLRSRQVAPVRDVEPTVTPFTSFAGFQGLPAFSPDGNLIAFAWTGGEGSQTHIYAKMIGTETQLQLTSGDDSYPSWSPDGRSIAFLRRSSEGVGVYQVPPLGGTVHRVAQLANASRVRWTRDAKFLFVGGRQTAADKPGIFVISADTGQIRALKLADAPGFSGPALSPDNKTLAFSRSLLEQGSELMIVALNDRLEINGEPRRLKTEQGANLPWDWTADGKEVIYVGGYPGVTGRLSRIAADGSGSPHAVAGANEGVAAAAISPRGDRLVFGRSFSDVNVWTVPLAGPGKSGTPVAFLASTRSEYSRPNAFSPDGRRLAFESDRSGKRTIWVANRDGSQAAPLIAGDAFTTGSPAWSPDGKWIAFDTRRDGNPEIYVVSSDGGPVRRITNHPSLDAVPSWSHDGKWIYFSSDRSGRFEIFKISVEGGDPVQVTRGGGWSTQESPDGKYLYYSRLRGPGGGYLIAAPRSPLLRMSVDGEETQVIDGVHERCWAATQEGIWYLWADNPQHGELRFFDFKTGKTSVLNTLTKPLAIGLSISPDGRQLLFNQVDQRGSEILLMENFR